MALPEKQDQAEDRRRQGPDSGQSLTERAATAARAELRGERAGILGAMGTSATPQGFTRARPVPDRWSLVHVMDRLEEGFRILARLPIATRPRGYVNSMPFPIYDRADLNAQLETYELEHMAQLRNRVRIRRRLRKSGAWKRRCIGRRRIFPMPSFITWRARSISARCGRHSMRTSTSASSV